MGEVHIGMKRAAMEDLRHALGKALRDADEGGTVEVTVDGDVNEHGSVLIISNDDMERPDVPDDAVYVEVEGG